jgi:SAM-dependent methyltransferase
MAHPICREAINTLVTGSAQEWPLDWFKRVYCGEPFKRGLSWGCGLGAFERWAIRRGVVSEIDGVDISETSLHEARRIARQDGLSGIRYRVGSFDAPETFEQTYDVVFFHASLHHVSNLEGLFESLRRSLVPGGVIYMDDYIGRSRHRWRSRHLKKAQAFLDRVPPEGKTRTALDFPVGTSDPSEAVRSEEIPYFFSRHFDVVEWKPYGGQITSVVLPWVRVQWAQTEEGRQHIQAMLNEEERELRRDPMTTAQVVAWGTLKRQVAARARIFAALPVSRRGSLRRASLALARAAFAIYWFSTKAYRWGRRHLLGLSPPSDRSVNGAVGSR